MFNKGSSHAASRLHGDQWMHTGVASPARGGVAPYGIYHTPPTAYNNKIADFVPRCCVVRGKWGLACLSATFSQVGVRRRSLPTLEHRPIDHQRHRHGVIPQTAERTPSSTRNTPCCLACSKLFRLEETRHNGDGGPPQERGNSAGSKLQW